jgi:hypothetical protein
VIKGTQESLIAPGLGVGSILLGQPFMPLTVICGQRAEITSFGDEKWLEFFKCGIDLCCNQMSRVTAISLFREGVEKHTEFKGHTSSGIGPGSTETEVLGSFGSPDSTGEPHIDRHGKTSRRWFSYNMGIAFEFSLDSKVDRIAVFAPFING